MNALIKPNAQKCKSVIPAKAGIQEKTFIFFHWTPAFAGVTA